MDDAPTLLGSIDGRKLAAHLETRGEFRRAFPLFFRAIGADVVARLAARYPDVAAHVGADCRREAIARWNDPRPRVDWVAFSFRGFAMWDLHVGVVAPLDAWPPVRQVGIHFSAACRSRVEPVLARVDWKSAVGERGEWVESPAIGEIQQRDRARALDLTRLADEAAELAARAVRYYEVVQPLVDPIG